MGLCWHDKVLHQVEEEGMELILMVLSDSVLGEMTGDRHGN